ncbi:7092_t:CDS:2 [Entrophospora sp. SA101]|nr:7092_t:CDS:2 [Entrophospora sp. SA101]CAJ0834690.1 5170_t:CDS:2 [Entrophospora sp. SA101]
MDHDLLKDSDSDVVDVVVDVDVDDIDVDDGDDDEGDGDGNIRGSKLWEIVLIGGKVGKVVIFDIIGGDGGGGDNEDEIFSNSIDSCDDEEVDIEIGLVRRREFLGVI